MRPGGFEPPTRGLEVRPSIHCRPAWSAEADAKTSAHGVSSGWSSHVPLGQRPGPVEYEWVPLCQKAFQGSETLMRAFFTAYGWPLPVPPT